MQKILFGIFAHPDDEAFGPCGTLLTEVASGTELHLITLTAGENGTNPDKVADLGATRLAEWQAAAQLFGATSTHHLGYEDGTLGNNDHIAVTAKIEAIVHDITAGREDYEIEFMSLDLNGLTGHIDHIVAGRSACLAFYRLRTTGLPMKRVRLACLAQTEHPHLNTDFVFMQPGRSITEINETIDARGYIAKIHEIMKCHHSQRSDSETQRALLGEGVAIDHFIVLQ